MADDQLYVVGTASVVTALFAWQVVSRRFDPFAPVWMFLVGYLQVYVIQATTLRDWALMIRGMDVVSAANARALWALLWFLAVYYSGVGKAIAGALPNPPGAWSLPTIGMLSPALAALGFYSASMVMNQLVDAASVSPEAALLYSFPFLTNVAAILLIVTGRQPGSSRPLLLAAGLGVAAFYILLWMYLGKRSPALIGVLSSVCAFYVARRSRPSWPVLMATAFVAALFVALAIGWRNNVNYDRSASGFVEYLGDFRVSSILKSLNVDDDDESKDPSKYISQESLEYGGFLLMLDTVPEKADYDYGANYLRCFSTFIPRLVWPDKPLYGRDKWVAAWIAGSEMKRDEDFAGPAISILGASQLNGGSLGTLIVLGVVAVCQRAGYEYYRRHDSVPWVQAWWALIFYTAWFAVVNDDPTNWFYYNWGFTCLPVVGLLWVVNTFLPAPEAPGVLAADLA